jgi:hypothetical protein
MKTSILIGLGVIVVVILFVIGLKFTAPSGSLPQAPQATTTPEQAGGNTSTSELNAGPFPGAPSSGNNSQSTTGTIGAKDIMQDPDLVKDSVNAGLYHLGYHLTPSSTTTPPYTIGYISSTHYFNISLLQEPIGSTREAMQAYLVAHLGLSEDQMCNLDYMVSVPASTNEEFSGENLGFSFCPGAVKLPQ